MDQESLATEKKELTLKERFKAFQGEITKISTRQRDLVESQRETYNEYHRLLAEQQELVTLDEGEAAGQLEPKIKALRAKVDNFQKEIEELSVEKIKEAISRHPNSKMHQMAEEIQKEGLEQMDVLQKELEPATSEIEKVKEHYLEVVGKIGNCYRGIVDLYVMVQRAEGVLPQEKRKSKRPSRIPQWIDYEIPEKELSLAYGKRPFIKEV